MGAGGGEGMEGKWRRAGKRLEAKEGGRRRGGGESSELSLL